MSTPGARLVPHLPDWAVILLAALVAAIPLVAPPLPPLTDLFGHLGRYAVQTRLAEDALLQRYYGFEWTLLPNLGADLLVQLLAPLMGLERSVKAIVIGTVMLGVAGLLILARQVHGRIPAGAFFALPLVYGYPFQFGFLNFCLSMALALLALALWIEMGRRGLAVRRALLFLPISAMLLIVHVAGWGAFGLFAFAAEFTRHHREDRGLLRSARAAIFHCLPLAVPAGLLMLFATQGSEGGTGDWFNWPVKMQWLGMVLNQRIELFDRLSAVLLAFVIAFAAWSARFMFDRALSLASLLLFAAFIILPRILIGSAYADMRLAPFMLAMALIAIDGNARPRDRAALAMLVAGAAFFLVRIAYVTVDFHRIGREFTRELGAVEHIEPGDRVLSFVGRLCKEDWVLERRTHLSSMAIVRKSAFVNDQFVMNGAQLLSIRYAKAKGLDRDPSQMVFGDRCDDTGYQKLSKATAIFPQDVFNKVWVINAPVDSRVDNPALRPIWHYKRSTLYRVVSPAPQSTTRQRASESAPAGASQSGTAP